MKNKSMMIPKDYHSVLDVRTTERAIKKVKDVFQAELAKALNLHRVSAPMMVDASSGLNDNLNGVERAVAFDVPSAKCNVEIVHSLAKWKRQALARYEYQPGEGIYTDMNAIRRDEELDNLHSVYVDQWDWEVNIKKEQRNTRTLINTVERIYDALKRTEGLISESYPMLTPFLRDKIYFITTQELEELYPKLSPKEREDAIAKEKGSVFIMRIGGILKSGIKHDGRAPDYDDWMLNGDIVLWYPILNRAFEVSSMGIRVDEDALKSQLEAAGCPERMDLPFHRALLNKELPYSIGGGIGQSRLCMFLLNKAHIGEVQAGIWSGEMIEQCGKANIFLL